MKNNSIENLNNQLIELKQLIEKLKNKEISNLEKDLLLEKVRTIYDEILKLETFVKPGQTPEPDRKEVNQTVVEVSSSEIDESIHELESDDDEIASEELITNKKVEEKVLEDNTTAGHTVDLFSKQAETVENEYQNSVLEPMVKEQKETVADKFQKNKISNLKNAIGINEKFFFINELFSGELNEYNKTVDSLDAMDNLNDAVQFLTKLRSEKGWDPESEAFLQLHQFVTKKLNA
ncbi:MAG: hypothetical protein K8S16_12835 [Bacteroidales bacterium]|nr:hypothetical protein [Bacteroidales bacterium]